MKNRYECSSCHGICDPGELEQGVCPECREKMIQDYGKYLVEGMADGIVDGMGKKLQDRSLEQFGKE